MEQFPDPHVLRRMAAFLVKWLLTQKRSALGADPEFADNWPELAKVSGVEFDDDGNFVRFTLGEPKGYAGSITTYDAQNRVIAVTDLSTEWHSRGHEFKSRILH